MITKLHNIKPIQNNIIFQFLENTVGGMFGGQKSKVGLITIASKSEQVAPRWGKVVSVGPRVNPEIKAGEYILIEHGMWTTQQWLDDGSKIWKTDDSKIIATSPDLNL
jgi:co-chaperonin GroES (HSP10)